VDDAVFALHFVGRFREELARWLLAHDKFVAIVVRQLVGGIGLAEAELIGLLVKVARCWVVEGAWGRPGHRLASRQWGLEWRGRSSRCIFPVMRRLWVAVRRLPCLRWGCILQPRL